MQKKYIVYLCLACFVLGASGAGIIAGYLARGQSAGEIALLNQRYDSLNREYTERQRIVESNVRQCLGYVESARAITERTSENSSRAIKNLREAVALIGQGIAENKSIKVELNNLRSGLYRIGDVAGLEVE